MKRLPKVLRSCIYGSFLFLSSSMLLFAVFEVSPDIRAAAHLDWIRYYAVRDRFVPDPVLVFHRRESNFTREERTRGDLYSPKYGVRVPPIDFVASYDEDGFRRNSATAPYDVLVIGDSYIEIGETTEDDTLSERLRNASGLATFNLGQSWYGPHQYVELLRRYAPQLKPKFALLCFFDGNDIQDVEQFENWAQGGDYYDFTHGRSFLSRYGVALKDCCRVFGKLMIRARYRLANEFRHEEESIHPDLGIVENGSRNIPMRFAYFPRSLSAHNLLGMPAWKTLRGLLGDFRDVSQRHEVTPILVFIPTKFQVYSQLASSDSGARFRESFDVQRSFRSSSRDAVALLAQDLGMAFIDLAPAFEDRAAQGDLLYHQFDTHWNSAGRQVAAEYIGIRLVEQRP